MINWGFLGASWVAGKALVPALQNAPNATLYAVASRDPQRSAKLNPIKVHNSYQELLEDPKVNAVYISLANHLHLEWATKALDAGKHVLCEKPMAITLADAKSMSIAAQANDRLLVEAIWTRWHPRFARVVELIKSGEIGELKSINSEFTFTRDIDENYRMNPDQGGGSLLDVGPYQAHVWVALTNKDADFVIDSVTQKFGETGVDMTTEISALIDSQVRVSALTSFEKAEAQGLKITGKTGTIEFPTGQAFTSWNEESSLRIGEYEEKFAPVDPFTLMVEDFGRKLTGESAWLPDISDSIRVIEILEQIKSKN